MGTRGDARLDAAPDAEETGAERITRTTSASWQGARILESCRAQEEEMALDGSRRDYRACNRAIAFDDLESSPDNTHGVRSDARITVRSAWTPEHLWVSYEVRQDEVSVMDLDELGWNCDALDFMLDPLINNHKDFPNERERRDDRQIAYDWSGDLTTKHLVFDEATGKLAREDLRPSAEEVAGAAEVTADGQGYVLEVRIAWGWLGFQSAPQKGTLIPALFSFADCDEQGCSYDPSQIESPGGACNYDPFSWVLNFSSGYHVQPERWGGALELVGEAP